MAAEVGVAIVPRWTSRMPVAGVRYIPLADATGSAADKLPLAAAWVRGTQDAAREDMVAMLRTNVATYAEHA